MAARAGFAPATSSLQPRVLLAELPGNKVAESAGVAPAPARKPVQFSKLVQQSYDLPAFHKSVGVPSSPLVLLSWPNPKGTEHASVSIVPHTSISSAVRAPYLTSENLCRRGCYPNPYSAFAGVLDKFGGAPWACATSPFRGTIRLANGPGSLVRLTLREIGSRGWLRPINRPGNSRVLYY